VGEHDRELCGGHEVHPADRTQVSPVRDVNDAVGVGDCVREPIEILEVATAQRRDDRYFGAVYC
jgi:hypothetical protein